jgi:polyisoprenoid-binding protein YceI
MKPQEAIKDSARDSAQTVWEIAPGYTTVQFSVKNFFFFTVEGRFANLTGTIVFDEADLRRSSVEAAVEAASIDTGIKQRDTHLRSKDFLDVERHPRIRFRSASVEKGRDRDTLRVAGELTIKGTSRDVILDVTQVDRSRSPQGEEIAYYTALAEVDRFDFGVSFWPGIIGRKVKVVIHAQAQRQS